MGRRVAHPPSEAAQPDDDHGHGAAAIAVAVVAFEEEGIAAGGWGWAAELFIMVVFFHSLVWPVFELLANFSTPTVPGQLCKVDLMKCIN